MKILIINYMETTVPGGINKTVREIAKNLSNTGHKLTILQANPLNLPCDEIFEGFRIVRIKSRLEKYLYGFNVSMLLHLKKCLKESNPDIVHVHGYATLFSTTIIYFIKKAYPNTTIVFSPHFDIYSHDTIAGKLLWGPYNKLIGRKVIKDSNVVIVASNFEAMNVNNILNAPTNKIVVISHGVDIIDIRKQHHNDDKINLLSAGYLLELKGIQYIIEALPELINKKDIDVFLTIIGKGPYEDQLKNLAKKLGVNDHIDWKGFVSSEELIDEFKKADLFLLTSKSENYGIVVTEALALGTPVIVTKRTALEEFLNEPGCFGIDYPPNPIKLSELIQDICAKDVKVGPFSNKIRTWDKVVHDYEKIYQNLLRDVISQE